MLKEAYENNSIITTGTPGCGSNGHFDKLASGLSCSHGYTVISVHEISKSPNSSEKERLVLVRNPWGVEKYTAKYSDSWNGWNDHLRKDLPTIG